MSLKGIHLIFCMSLLADFHKSFFFARMSVNIKLEPSMLEPNSMSGLALSFFLQWSVAKVPSLPKAIPSPDSPG